MYAISTTLGRSVKSKKIHFFLDVKTQHGYSSANIIILKLLLISIIFIFSIIFMSSFIFITFIFSFILLNFTINFIFVSRKGEYS